MLKNSFFIANIYEKYICYKIKCIFQQLYKYI